MSNDKLIDSICETFHKARVPLSEDQRAILAGCLYFYLDKEQADMKAKVIKAVKKLVTVDDSLTMSCADMYYSDEVLEAINKAFEPQE